MSHLFLFDIDMTLIRTRGVGSSAMNQVMAEMIGVEQAFDGIDFGGRTDRAIIRDALRNHGHTPEPEAYEEFLTEFERRYIPRLEAEMAARGGEVLPGVREVLAAVTSLPDVRVGIATGNFRRGAMVKLRHFDLHHHFADGGFADDAEDRSELVSIAIKRMGGQIDGHQVFVIGDTHHDIEAALANRAVAIGVATGRQPAARLVEAGAHHIFDDLSAHEDVMRALLASHDTVAQ